MRKLVSRVDWSSLVYRNQLKGWFCCIMVIQYSSPQRQKVHTRFVKVKWDPDLPWSDPDPSFQNVRFRIKVYLVKIDIQYPIPALLFFDAFLSWKFLQRCVLVSNGYAYISMFRSASSFVTIEYGYKNLKKLLHRSFILLKCFWNFFL